MYSLFQRAFSSLTILCSSPTLIPNPNYKRPFKAGDPFSMKDCTSEYLAIPCGHCDECIAVKQMYIVQRVQMEALSNHVFFATITYNNDMLPSLVTSQDREIRYTDYRDIQLMMKRIRNDNAFGVPFRYFAVTERGSEKARPHAHILFFVPKGERDNYSDIMHLENILFDVVLKYWSRNVGTNRKPLYMPCCTYIRKVIRGKVKTTYDLHYVWPDPDDPSCCNVAFYVLKYMLKSSYHDRRLQQALRLNYDDEEYRDTWKLVRSRHIASKGFGLSPDSFGRKGLGDPDPKILKYLRECVEISKKSHDYDYPLYFNSVSGQSFPLAPYYKKRGIVFSYSDALDFYWNKNTKYIDSSEPRDSRFLNRSDVLKYFHECQDRHSIADELCDADLFDELFE